MIYIINVIVSKSASETTNEVLKDWPATSKIARGQKNVALALTSKTSGLDFEDQWPWP